MELEGERSAGFNPSFFGLTNTGSTFMLRVK
jgi:hypothetical protein